MRGCNQARLPETVAEVFLTHKICAPGYRAAESTWKSAATKSEENKTDSPVPRVPQSRQPWTQWIRTHGACAYILRYQHTTRSSGAAAAYLHSYISARVFKNRVLLHAITNHIQVTLSTPSVRVRAQGDDQSSSEAYRVMFRITTYRILDGGKYF